MFQKYLLKIKRYTKIVFLLLVLFCFSSFNQVIFCQNKEHLEIEFEKQFAEEKYHSASMIIDKLIGLDSANSEYHIKKAKIKFALGDYNSTIRSCYSALKITPNLSEAYILRGHVCKATESYGGAVLFYNKALINTNDDHIKKECYYNRGLANYELGKYDEAYSDLKIAAADSDNDIHILIALSNVFNKTGRIEESIEHLEKVIQLDENYIEAYLLLAGRYMTNSNFRKAISAYNNYIKVKSNDIEALNDLGLAYYENGQYSEGLGILNKVLSININNAKAYKYRALIFIKLNREELACNDLFISMQMGYIEQYGYDILDLYLEKCEK